MVYAADKRMYYKCGGVSREENSLGTLFLVLTIILSRKNNCVMVIDIVLSETSTGGDDERHPCF
jgi:hypothetical protein